MSLIRHIGYIDPISLVQNEHVKYRFGQTTIFRQTEIGRSPTQFSYRDIKPSIDCFESFRLFHSLIRAIFIHRLWDIDTRSRYLFGFV